MYEEVLKNWGSAVDIEILAPSSMHDERFKNWLAAYFRRSASPGDAVALLKMNTNIDIRNILPSIRVPTLILHRTHDRDIKVEEGRYIASRIPGAKFIELEGSDHLPWSGDYKKMLDEVEVFLTGELKPVESERILATVLFTDIVDSTKLAAKLGDARWQHTLESFYDLSKKEIERFRGKEIVKTGDGFLATFDGPARAIRCACSIRDSCRTLGIMIRAGLHTGECELMQNNVGGIAVFTGARVMAEAANNEVWVSSTVKDLVAGSGIQFESMGKFSLKGIPEEWELYAVSN